MKAGAVQGGAGQRGKAEKVGGEEFIRPVKPLTFQ